MIFTKIISPSRLIGGGGLSEIVQGQPAKAPGNFEYDIRNSPDGYLFIFNDNEEDAGRSKPGLGNAAIRPFLKHRVHDRLSAGAHIWVLGGLSSRENNTLLKNAPRPVGTMAGGLSPRVPSLGEPFDYPLSPPNIV